MQPESFESGLRQYDPQLSLRWGNAIKAWIVERTERVSASERALLFQATRQPDAPPKAHEEWIAAKAGKHVVLYTLLLDRRVFDNLFAIDLQRHGTKVVDRHLKRAEEKKIAKQRASKALAEQGGDVINWALRKHKAEIDAGKSDELIEQALRGKKAPAAASKMLFDATGTPIVGKPEVKLELATK